MSDRQRFCYHRVSSMQRTLAGWSAVWPHGRGRLRVLRPSHEVAREHGRGDDAPRPDSEEARPCRSRCCMSSRSRRPRTGRRWSRRRSRSRPCDIAAHEIGHMPADREQDRTRNYEPRPGDEERRRVLVDGDFDHGIDDTPEESDSTEQPPAAYSHRSLSVLGGAPPDEVFGPARISPSDAGGD
jgi:hypothetical protein